MGRPSTGATTTDAALRIELSYLLKKGYLEKGTVKSSRLSWKDGRGHPAGNITIHTFWLEDEKYIRLVYTITDKRTNEKTERNYKIYLEGVPSNLGKGEVLYFICPVSGKRCRILYSAYASDFFKSREAYQNRIYYPSQISSKMDYANDRYWTLEKQINKFWNVKNFQYVYDGKLTKKALRLQKLKGQQNYWDRERWMPKSFPKSLRGKIRTFDS